jgi:hypothetical protein
MGKVIEMIIEDYEHFIKNAKEFNLKKSFARIGKEKFPLEKLHLAQGVESKEDGLYLNGKNIFPGAVLTCVVELDTK